MRQNRRSNRSDVGSLPEAMVTYRTYSGINMAIRNARDLIVVLRMALYFFLRT